MLRTPRVRSHRYRRLLRRIRLNTLHGPFPLERCCAWAPGFLKPTASSSLEPLAGRSLRPSRPPFTARALRLRLPGCARFRSSLEAPGCCSLVNLAATGSRERKRPDTQHTKRHRAGCEGCPRAGETLRAFGGLRVGTGKAGDQPMSTQNATEQDARRCGRPRTSGFVA